MCNLELHVQSAWSSTLCTLYVELDPLYVGTRPFVRGARPRIFFFKGIEGAIPNTLLVAGSLVAKNQVCCVILCRVTVF